MTSLVVISWEPLNAFNIKSCVISIEKSIYGGILSVLNCNNKSLFSFNIMVNGILLHVVTKSAQLLILSSILFAWFAVSMLCLNSTVR